MVKKLIFPILLIFLSSLLFLLNQEKVIGNKILLGQSCALNGPAKELGTKMMEGANAYFKHINDKGGIYNRKIELKTLNDSYEPDYAIKNTIKFIEEDDVFALFGEVGTPTSKAVLPIAIKNEIPFLFPFSGASFLRNPENKMVVNLRKSYNEEIEALMNYLKDVYKIKKIAVLYQNDSYGKPGFEGIQKTAIKVGSKVVASGYYRRNTLSYRNALYKIKDSNPEAIIMIGAYKAVGNFIKAARREGMNDVKFCNISFVGSEALIKNLNYQTENVIISEVVPLPFDNSNKAVKEYQEIYSKYYPNSSYDFVSLEGFLSAKLFVKALEETGEKLTRKKFMESFNNLESNAIEGLSISLSKTDKEALNKVYITDYHNGKFRVLKEVTIND